MHPGMRINVDALPSIFISSDAHGCATMYCDHIRDRGSKSLGELDLRPFISATGPSIDRNLPINAPTPRLRLGNTNIQCAVDSRLRIPSLQKSSALIVLLDLYQLLGVSECFYVLPFSCSLLEA